jgi:hypothetical protein
LTSVQGAFAAASLADLSIVFINLQTYNPGCPVSRDGERCRTVNAVEVRPKSVTADQSGKQNAPALGRGV